MTQTSSSLGIDVGGTHIKWEQIEGPGDAVAYGRVDTPSGGELAVAQVLAGIIGARLPYHQGLASVGIAIPGHLTPERDEITLLPNVPGNWPGFAIKSWLQERTGIAPVLLNDARAFATAELERGAARGAEIVVFATIGTGIGGAVAVRGEVISTGRDTFGEVGHTTAIVDGDQCACGGHGCVEAYAGGTYVLKRAARNGVDIQLEGSALESLASSADPIAHRVLEEAYDAFAVGISSACAFSGANLVVVGGAVATELPGYIERTRTRLAARRRLLGDVIVRPALLGGRAGALGAALAARSICQQSTQDVEQSA